MVLAVICAMAITEMPEFPRLRPVPWTDVEITDQFWSPRQLTNRKTTIAHGFAMLKEHGYEENFLRAGQRLEGGFQGLVFQDSDVYKILESAAASLATHPDKEIQKQFDYWVGLLEKAQLEDGYLNTYFQLKEPTKKWANLRDLHELYCAGHLIEAGVADFVGNGTRRLLNVAIKSADHIDKRFGPGKAPGYPGHPELELALIKLWQATGERRYYELARHFVKSRGTHYFAKEHGTPEGEYSGAYWQDRVPIANLDVIEGHAVRAAYLLSAATDVVRETGDSDLEKMLRRVWSNAVHKRMYVTGGIGNSSSNEGFTVDYDLPNESAYQETCASIAMVFWNQRMGMLYGDSIYADAVERALYNGVMSGISLDGTKFFYENPLASAGGHHRRDWYACACCPPNISRLLSTLGEYVYMRGENSLWVNQFVAGKVDTIVGGQKVEMRADTNYPWDGKVTFTPKSESDLEVRIRIPSWCESYDIKIGGRSIKPQVQRGYAVMTAAWDGKQTIEAEFEMPIRRVQSHPSVASNVGRVAIARGPLVYCFEQADQTVDLDQIYLPIESSLAAQQDKALGVQMLVGNALAVDHFRWPGGLYRNVGEPKKVTIRAVPYAFWGNREPGKMAVWMPTSAPTPRDIGPEGDAKVSVSFRSDIAYPEGVNDGEVPKTSGEQPGKLCHFWPHKGGTEWIQYDFDGPILIDHVKVYFFDDTGRGECRIPKSWHVEAFINGRWEKVPAHYKPEIDKWCEVAFEPVSAPAFRLVLQMEDGWAAGVHEWKLFVPQG